MSRLQQLLLAVGVGFILFGLLLRPVLLGAQEVDAPDQHRGPAPESTAEPPAPGAATTRRAAAPVPGAPVGVPDGLPVAVPDGTPDEPETRTSRDLVHVVRSSDRSAVSNARVSLWTTAQGEGPSWRPARRIGRARATDDVGFVAFDAPDGVPLEVLARVQTATVSSGASARAEIAPLAPGEQHEVSLAIEPAAFGLRVQVIDRQNAAPVPNAALRLPHVGADLPSAWPGPTVLVTRTDETGEATLPGETREAAYLVVDSGAHAPCVVARSAFESASELTVEVTAPASVEVRVSRKDETPLAHGLVFVRAEIVGASLEWTQETDAWGSALLRRLPADLPLQLSAAPDAVAVETVYGTLLLESGENQPRELTLDR